jgi:hypothetical protein
MDLNVNCGLKMTMTSLFRLIRHTLWYRMLKMRRLCVEGKGVYGYICIFITLKI